MKVAFRSHGVSLSCVPAVSGGPFPFLRVPSWPQGVSTNTVFPLTDTSNEKAPGIAAVIPSSAPAGTLSPSTQVTVSVPPTVIPEPSADDVPKWTDFPSERLCQNKEVRNQMSVSEPRGIRPSAVDQDPEVHDLGSGPRVSPSLSCPLSLARHISSLKDQNRDSVVDLSDFPRLASDLYLTSMKMR